MITRIGRVTNIFPDTGKVKVVYEDEGNTSLPLSMLTMNQEYSMPSVGDRVVTLHMENGSTKGFVLGTYYGGNVQPKAKAGYRKDFGRGAYASFQDGVYLLYSGGASVSMDGGVKIDGGSVELKAAKKVIISSKDITLRCSYGEVNVEDMMKRIERIEDQLGIPHTI